MSYFKSQPIRSKALRESARGEPCSLRLPGCDDGSETTVLCHMPCAGRGIARKASDLMSFYACHACHAKADGRVPYQVTPELFYKALIMAHAETMQRWVDARLIMVRGAS